MILHALSEYFDRKQNDPEDPLAPEGLEYKEIPFVIELDRAGGFVQLKDTRREHIDPKNPKRKQLRASRYLVPKDCGRASNIQANLLWDKPDYLLGYIPETATDNERLKIPKRHQSFIDTLHQACPDAFQDEGINAVKAFLAAGDFQTLYASDTWAELIKGMNPFISFQILGDKSLVAERPLVQDFLLEKLVSEEQTDAPTIFCLLSGNYQKLARLHPKIKGVPGANTSGAGLATYNAEAYNSYGKKQGANAPVGQSAAAAYTTALNHLLGKDSRNKIQLPGTTMVFWAQKSVPLESFFTQLFGYVDNPDEGRDAVNALYSSHWKGKLTLGEDPRQNRFYVLGLSPNVARLSVRFWSISTVAEMGERLKQHFDDLELIHGEKESGQLPVIRLLKSIAVQGDSKNVPETLEGVFVKAIVEGTAYPQALLQAAIRRCHAEQSVPFARAALIKACLNRNYRQPPRNEKEYLKVSLDESNTNPGYCLGRLFAVLEKTQEDASGGNLNATIADRFFGAASGRPASVFPTLIRLNRHHLNKIENPKFLFNLKNRIQQIINQLENSFPRQLSLEDQGAFAIGYYHQRQDFYTKKPIATPTAEVSFQEVQLQEIV